jgi:hypothetical protein
LAGGVHFIFLGRGSDEPVEELESLLRELEPQLAAPRSPVLLSLEAGPVSELFAPTPPPLRAVPRFLLWLFTPQGLEDWLETPARLQALLRTIHRLRHATEPVTQCAYFERDSGPGAAVLARLLAGLGLYICEAQPDPERLFLVEAHRPDATIITKLMGRPFPLPGAADTVLATVYAQQAQAQAQGDATRLRSLELLERGHLCRELQALLSEPHRPPPLRAPRLCRLLRTAVEQGGPTARRELERELLERARPLPLLMGPDGQGVPARLPGIGPVLRVYPELFSLQRAVKELGLAEGSYRAGAIPARDLFAFGAKENIPVVLNLSLTAHASQDVRWSPAEARLLAQGQHSTQHGLASELLRGAVLDPDERSFQASENTVIGRKAMSLELTAKEQQAAHAADAMLQTLRLMNGNQPYPGLPPGAIPLSELEAGVVDGQMFRIKRALRVGVDPNEQTVQFGTALHAAAHAGQLDIARLLVDYGANPQARDDQGRTPAELARLQKHWDIAAFLDSAAG